MKQRKAFWLVLSLTAIVVAGWAPADDKKETGAENLPKRFKNSVGMDMILVPDGSFRMGSPEDEENREKSEGPQRKVTISRFYCSKYEVTRGQFRAFVKDTEYRTDAERGTLIEGGYGWDAEKKTFRQDAKFHWQNVGFAQTDEHPVCMVSYNDASAFVAWLNHKDRRKGGRYALLREAEFEYVHRAGTQKLYAHGDDAEDLVKYANIADGTAKKQYPDWPVQIKAEDGYVFTAPVGKFRPNALGLYDLTGNVMEWCEDWYDESYYSEDKNVNPSGPATGTKRVLRGNSFSHNLASSRPAFRNSIQPAFRCIYIGFRVCFRPE